MKILLNFMLALVLGATVSACNDRSHTLQGGNGGGDDNGDNPPQKPTQVPPQYLPNQFIEGSNFVLSETMENFVDGKWIGELTCFLWEISKVENGLVELDAKKYLRCDDKPLPPELWKRVLIFDAESGKVLSDEESVNQRPRNGDLFDKKIFFYFFANGKEKVLFDTFEALKVEGKTYPAFTIDSVSYLNAPGTSLHGLLLQRTDVAANKKQRVKWSLRKLNNLSPK